MNKRKLKEIRDQLKESRSKLQNEIRYVDNLIAKSWLNEIESHITNAIDDLDMVL